MPLRDPAARRAYDRAYNAAHREEVRAYQRAYYAAHKGLHRRGGAGMEAEERHILPPRYVEEKG
jgi:hypothetical protein